MDFPRQERGTVWRVGRVALLLVLLTVSLAHPGGAAFAQATALALNSAQGPVGTSVVATASGFAPGDTLSLFLFPMTEPVATATADASGGAQIPFAVPSLEAGAHLANVQSAAARSADATFTITAAEALALSPAQGPVGTSVAATASGFAPGDTLSLFVFPMTEPVATATADASGGAQIPFAVPNLAVGAHEANLQSAAGATASATLTITAAEALALSPAHGPVGTSVTATASGFAPGDTLSLFVFPMTEPVATATADASGGAHIPFAVPNLAVGAHEANLQSAAGATASATLTITAAEALALSPAQGPVGTSVVATASGFAPGATLSLFVFPMTKPLATATADASGGARIPFTVPDYIDAGGRQVWVGSPSGAHADTTFTITPAEALAP